MAFFGRPTAVKEAAKDAARLRARVNPGGVVRLIYNLTGCADEYVAAVREQFSRAGILVVPAHDGMVEPLLRVPPLGCLTVLIVDDSSVPRSGTLRRDEADRLDQEFPAGGIRLLVIDDPTSSSPTARRWSRRAGPAGNRRPR